MNRLVVEAGVRIGVDVGSVRVGVAVSDPDGRLATPLMTLRREMTGRELDRLAGIVKERAATAVIVGLPLRLTGGEGAAATEARQYAVDLARRVAPVPVFLCDERFTTVIADQSLRQAGMSGRSRRKVIDQTAAATVLQSSLDAERAGRSPGERVVVP